MVYVCNEQGMEKTTKVITKRADLEDETVAEVLDILRAEFEDEE